MIAAAIAPICANPECRVAETGKCVEGLAPGECSHYGRSVASKALGEVRRPDGVALDPGERLPVNGAEDIMRSRETRVVAVIGPRDAGKTSLIAGLYGLFLDGAVAGWAFAGGRTLRAFEIACHDARAVSKRQVPHFERTHRDPSGLPAGLYQLALSSQPGSVPVDLLIADRAGEEYLEMADDSSTVTSLHELARADVITLLLDGKRLLDIGARHNLVGDLALMLQAIHDGDVLSGGQRLAIALTKHDEFDGSPQRERAERDFNEFVVKIRALFAGSFSAIEPFRLSASPESDAGRRGAGVSELLAFWMRPAVPLAVAMPAGVSISRAFGRLAPSAG